MSNRPVARLVRSETMKYGIVSATGGTFIAHLTPNGARRRNGGVNLTRF